MKLWFKIGFVLFALCRGGQAQGFFNLGFENAVIKTNGFMPYEASAYYALPDWSVYNNGIQAYQILFNTINLDEPAVTIQGTNSSSLTPISGNFSVFLQGGSQYADGTNGSAIGQTGQIPSAAESITYWGASYNVPQITFDGQPLAFSALSSTPDYTVYGADIGFCRANGTVAFLCSATGRWLHRQHPVFLQRRS